MARDVRSGEGGRRDEGESEVVIEELRGRLV